MSRGREANMHEKLAAALIQIGFVDREAAKTMTAKEIISLVHCDHDPVPKATEGTNHPTNLIFRSIIDHQEKTAKYDIPMIAKGKRITKKEEEFRRRMLAKNEPGVAAGEEGTARVRAKRAWPSQPLQSRGFERKKTL